MGGTYQSPESGDIGLYDEVSVRDKPTLREKPEGDERSLVGFLLVAILGTVLIYALLVEEIVGLENLSDGAGRALRILVGAVTVVGLSVVVWTAMRYFTPLGTSEQDINPGPIDEEE